MPTARRPSEFFLKLLRDGVLTYDRRTGKFKRVYDFRCECDVDRAADKPHRRGYLQLVAADRSGRIVSALSHVVAWEWCHGPVPKGYAVNHIDRNRKNNAIGNLELLTVSQNNAYARREAFEL